MTRPTACRSILIALFIATTVIAQAQLNFERHEYPGANGIWLTVDLNHDGRADFVVHSSAAGNLGVVLSQSGGGYAPRVESTSGSSASLVSLAAGDADGDGDEDLFAADGS